MIQHDNLDNSIITNPNIKGQIPESVIYLMSKIDLSTDIYLKILNYLDTKSIFKLMISSTSNKKQLKEILNKRKFKIDLSDCKIMDAGLAHLKGIHTINL